MEIEIHGIKTRVEIKGEGPSILLLHGWGARLETFHPFMEAFKEKFQVVAFDFPGFGQTALPNSVWGVKEYAAFTMALIEKCALKNPVLIGHSFGGRVIIELMGNRMLQASKIILVDSAGIRPRRKFRYYFKVGLFKTVKHVLQFPLWGDRTKPIMEKARNFFGSTDYKSANPLLRKIMVKVVNQDLRHLLPHIAVPALLIWGSEDQDTPLRDAKIMEKMIPDAGLVVFEGAGHFSYLEKAGNFHVVANQFLKDLIME